MHLVDTQQNYYCPGEDHPITAAVHHSRQAAGYYRCRECEHRIIDRNRNDQTLQGIELPNLQNSAVLIQQHRLRGTYLQELTFNTLLQKVYLHLPELWQQHLRTFRQDQSSSPTTFFRPTLAIGSDERPASLELYRDLQLELCLTGIHLVDLGSLPASLFAFAINYFQLNGGVYLTGSGCGAAYGGLDLFRERGIPWTLEDRKNTHELRNRTANFRPRLSRSSGTKRIERIETAYVAHLQKYFHGLRPLKVCLTVSSEAYEETIRSIFERLPCQLDLEVTHLWGYSFSERPPEINHPWETRSIPTLGNPVNKRMSARIKEQRADFGMVMGEDGGACQLFDETGNAVEQDRTCALIHWGMEHELPGCPLFVSQNRVTERFSAQGTSQGIQQVSTSLSTSAMVLDHQRQGLGWLEDGAFWYYDQHPRCDAMISLAWILKSLSYSDETCKTVLDRIPV